MTISRFQLAGLVLALVTAGCGSRPTYWDTGIPSGSISFGLTNGVALVDDPAHRVVLLTALAGQQLSKQSFPIGHNVLAQATTTSPDGSRLFVLSAGDSPRHTETDQWPELTVLTIDPTTFATTTAEYKMSVPLPNLAIDPLGHWAVAYSGPGAPATFVQNANELVIFDLTAPSGSAPITQTIRSQGGTPQRLTFTPELNLAKVPGNGRLLIVETDIDVTLVELANPTSDVTLSLTSGTSAERVTPAGVVVDSGFDPTNSMMPGPPRIALKAQDNTNVFTFTLGPSDTNDFTPIVNVIDVGGPPTDIAFVRVDQDLLRVAALVPSKSSAVLVDSDDGNITQVDLPAAYSSLSLVTSVLGSPGTDVAMLWSATATGVALWTLGNTVGQPYHSIEVLPIAQQVQQVDEVAKQTQLKVLETTDPNAGSGFLVLDLLKGTASPLQTSARATLSIAPNGQRLWAYAQGGTDLAQVDFATLNPVPLTTTEPIDVVYDVQRPSTGPGGDGGSSLIAIHNQGTVGATVFDAVAPDTASARIVPALLLEGP
ncbi:MAG: hypothetical protein WBY94_12925 [Polyangiaceae bacterium]